MRIATFTDRIFASTGRRLNRHEHLALEFSGGNYLIHTYDSPQAGTAFIEVRVRLHARWSDQTATELRSRSLLLHHGQMMDGYPPYLFEFEAGDASPRANAAAAQMAAGGDCRLVLVARKYYPQGIPAAYLNNLPLRIRAVFRTSCGETAEVRGGIGSSGKAVIRTEAKAAG
ncbi:MAG TPA: hypothetical protein VK473_00550 [Terriglobales bacterium]|nr:hypothetical protein [Terriglobales bacterium]